MMLRKFSYKYDIVNPEVPGYKLYVGSGDDLGWFIYSFFGRPLGVHHNIWSDDELKLAIKAETRALGNEWETKILGHVLTIWE